MGSSHSLLHVPHTRVPLNNELTLPDSLMHFELRGRYMCVCMLILEIEFMGMVNKAVSPTCSKHGPHATTLHTVHAIAVKPSSDSPHSYHY